MHPGGIEQAQLPEHAHPLGSESLFQFACHKGVGCFTECCRLLELALTPYDVLRLRKSTQLGSGEFLDRYVIVEQEDGEAFPRLYLTMIDDGRGSCPFVSPQGCTVYDHRPGACRAYPVGRAVVRRESGAIEEHFVLVREEHCQGFSEAAAQSAEQYCAAQGLAEYNTFNDLFGTLLQHEKIRQGWVSSPAGRELFLTALYDLDRMRTLLRNGEFSDVTPIVAQNLTTKSDEDLLLFAIPWLKKRLLD
jgi:Fe-S-cluster containining protein